MAHHLYLLQFHPFLCLVLHFDSSDSGMDDSISTAGSAHDSYGTSCSTKLYVMAMNDLPTFCIVQPIPFLII